MLNLSYRTILSVAIPLMGSTFIQSIVLLTDSSFLSRYDTLAFDAAGNGGLIYITMFMTLVGLNEGTQILMARRIGENRESLLPRIFGSSIIINFFIAAILFLFSWFILPDIISSNARNMELGQMQVDYVQIRSYGIIPSTISLAILAYFTSTGKTFMILINSLIIAFANIGMDYTFIFGHFGFSEMGLDGAAIASTISDYIGLIFLVIAIYLQPTARKHEMLSKFRVKWSTIKKLFILSSPIMLQGLAALLTWTVFFFWIEQMGVFELTVSQNIRSLYFLAFVPIWGFGATTKTYVSHYIGRKDFKSVAIATRRIQLLTVIFLFVIFHGALFYPEKLIALVNPEQEFIATSAETLRFLFGSMMLYGFCSVYFYTISGSGNTRYILIIELISVLAYIVCAYLFIKVLKWDIYSVWSVEYIYFGVIGILSISYLKFFNWKKKQI
ncbi:MAG: MATE family efflux transporter [Crocinitomicaceae bacterium]|nr:MATE family efflux transporter [Flavobacteriales bacterium]NQZ35198.1 MATE family efflux transporter [Crocinitomicaceae bacterium]